MEEQFYIDQLTAKSENMIWITGGTGTESIYGFVDGPTTLGAQSTWGDGMLGGEAANTLLQGVSTGANMVGAPVIKSIYSTIQTWQSASFNAMAFNVIVVANKEGENPLDMANRVWDYVLPENFGGGLVSTPGGYTTSLFGGQTGAVSLFIGNWFASPNSWLVSSATIEVSKQRVKSSGHPLYVKIDMVLNPARMFHADEVKGWIRGAR